MSVIQNSPGIGMGERGACKTVKSPGTPSPSVIKVSGTLEITLMLRLVLSRQMYRCYFLLCHLGHSAQVLHTYYFFKFQFLGI